MTLDRRPIVDWINHAEIEAVISRYLSCALLRALLAPLDPLPYMKSLNGRCVLMIDGMGASRMPRHHVEKLYRACSGSKELRWLDIGHVHRKDREFGRLVG